MSTYTQIIYQIVFSTKNHNMTMIGLGQETLYKFIGGILMNKKCHPYQIGGIENHLHIITDIHPSVALASLVKDIKVSSSRFIKTEHLFPKFISWQVGYGAFTYSISAKENLIKYVKNQKKHHNRECFKDEYIHLLNKNDIDFDEKYLL